MDELAQKDLVLLGSGGHARVVLEAAEASGCPLAGYLSSQPAMNGLAWLGSDDWLAEGRQARTALHVAIGYVDRAGAVRRSGILDRIDEFDLFSIVHPEARVSASADIEAGVFIACGAILGAACRIGPSAIINTGAIVDHDVKVGRNTHISVGARIAGSVSIAENCLVGMGALILQGLYVGSGAVIGAGAVVTRDVAPNETVVGAPATPVRLS